MQTLKTIKHWIPGCNKLIIPEGTPLELTNSEKPLARKWRIARNYEKHPFKLKSGNILADIELSDHEFNLSQNKV